MNKRNGKYISNSGTFTTVSILFLLLNVVQYRTYSAELLPFEPISEVKEFFVFTTAIEFDGEVTWVGTLNGLVQLRPGENRVFNTSTGHTNENHVTGLVSNGHGEVWVTLWGGGVFYLNSRSGE